MAEWAGFVALGVIWGSSYLLIKIGVGEFTPLQLVAVRVALAAVAMVTTLYLTGQRFPKDRASLRGLFIVGMFNTAVPFMLITWGEQSIDSGLATVLNSTVPLFSLVIAHFALQDERINRMKVFGLVSGFVGVMILTSRSTGQEAATNDLAGQLAVLLASVCYAGTAVFVRRKLRHLQPMVISSGALLASTVVIGGAMLLFDGLPRFDGFSNDAVASVLILGLLNTYIAYLLFYWILDHWGATRTTLVTYLMPPVGLTLGAIFLQEVLDSRLFLGAALIVAGVALVNWRRKQAEVVPEAATPPSSVAESSATSK